MMVSYTCSPFRSVDSKVIKATKFFAIDPATGKILQVSTVWTTSAMKASKFKLQKLFSYFEEKLILTFYSSISIIPEYQNSHGKQLLSNLNVKENDSGVFIYLPTGQTYKSVYDEYKKSFYLTHEQSEKVISYFTFRKLWLEIIPNLQFQPHASDLCEVCTSFKSKLLVAKQNIDEYNKLGDKDLEDKAW
ncbi:23425_t:CDS:2 [Gigaspora rosea]|nr:23425_t:CDS:2 [Gigaspora rosea]